MHLFWYTPPMRENPQVLSVRFFCTEAGNEPVREWLNELPPRPQENNRNPDKNGPDRLADRDAGGSKA